jgi:hypothetical protein
MKIAFLFYVGSNLHFLTKKICLSAFNFSLLILEEISILCFLTENYKMYTGLVYKTCNIATSSRNLLISYCRIPFSNDIYFFSLPKKQFLWFHLIFFRYFHLKSVNCPTKLPYSTTLHYSALSRTEIMHILKKKIHSKSNRQKWWMQ